MLAKLQDKFPGVEFNFSQYLQDNVSEAVSGVKGENSIKLFGNDLQALTDPPTRSNRCCHGAGITDLACSPRLANTRSRSISIAPKAARYGDWRRRHQRHHQGGDRGDSAAISMNP